MRPKPSPTSRWVTAGAAPLILIIVLAGCGASTTSKTGSGTTGGATPSSGTATSTTGQGDGTTGGIPPTIPVLAAWPNTGTGQRAAAWWQSDASSVPQLWASIDDAPSRQITHVAPDHAECSDQVAWSLPVFSPDLTHIAAALGSPNCGDGPMTGPLSIITVSNGTVTPVPAAGANTTIRLSTRDVGWIDNATVWYITFSGLHTYHLGAAAPVTITSLSSADDAVLRGTTLFWENYDSYGHGVARLHRYSLSSHSDLGTSIALGTVPACGCSPGDYSLPGWDASPDGTHIVYQTVTYSGTDVSGSQFFYANADGSGATRIARNTIAHALVDMQISHNGRLVAITNATPSPSVITASVTSPGNANDPDVHFYAPDAAGLPLWQANDAGFFALSYSSDAASPNAVVRFLVGSPSGAEVVKGGLNAWYSVGS